MPKARREYGEGSIREITRNGRTFWQARVSAGLDAFGERDQRAKNCATEKEAKAALSKLEAEIREGAAKRQVKKSIALGPYLDEWIADLRANATSRESTIDRYADLMRVHAIPIIGKLPLQQFDAKRALLLYKELAARGASDSTRKKVHSVLSVALGDAVPDLIPFNPLKALPQRKKPKYTPAEREPYSQDEVRALLAAVAGDRYEALYVLAIFSQMREDEIFRLERANVHFGNPDVDDDPSFVLVRKSKSDAGVRRVDLPAIAHLALLWHLSPASLLWRKASASPLVFPGTRGARLIGRNFLRRELYPAMERAKLRQITFHDLRHSGAMLIAHKVPITVLRERLGHTSNSTTLHYAGKRSPGNQGVAVAALDEITAKWTPKCAPNVHQSKNGVVAPD